MRLWLLLIGALVAALATGPALADRTDYTSLARRGWTYELRSTMLGRDMSIPVHINGKDLAGASICIVGERPHKGSRAVLDAFAALMRAVFGKPLPMRYAGHAVEGCGAGRTVILRFFSGHPPHQALTRDLDWLNRTYQLGLPRGREYAVTSPAMAQTFFGRRGQGTHIMVQQAGTAAPGVLERAYFKSILVEELFQAFSFGMDIMVFDRSAGFISKLQETPMNLQRLPWSSRAFMRALLASNPEGLCPFDVFMLHAVAAAPVDETIEPAFIAYIEERFDSLLAASRVTLEDPSIAAIVSPECTAAQLR